MHEEEEKNKKVLQEFCKMTIEGIIEGERKLKNLVKEEENTPKYIG